MSLLGNIVINDSAIMILLFKAFPLLFIMIILFIIAINFSKKAVTLNNCFVTNNRYEDKYNYLMNKTEYENSVFRKKRIIFYEKTKLKKKRDDEGV